MNIPSPITPAAWDALDPFEQRARLISLGWPVESTAWGFDLTLGASPGSLCALVTTGKVGLDNLKTLETAHGKLPVSPAFGRSGTRVRLFRVPEGVILPSASDLFGQVPGLELVGSGAIPVPPTVDDHVCLNWYAHGHPARIDPAELPAWLSVLATDHAAAKSAGARVAAAAGTVRTEESAEVARAFSEDASTAIIPSPGRFALTDVGNAERLAYAHGADIRWVEALDTYLLWNGTRWARDTTGEAVRRAVDAIRRIGAEAMACDAESERKFIWKHALKSESAGAIRAALSLCKSQPGIAITTDALDADPWLLNCTNGLLDLRTGKLGPHRREALCTKLAPVAYDPDAECPMFDAFLERVQPDPDVSACLLRVLGYALTGVIREHVLPIHHGTGRNGKGTLRDAVLGVMGDYGTEVPASLLMAKDREGHPTEKMVLRDARFASASETAKGRAIDEALVKLLTGGDPITARYMGCDFVTFKPTHKLWLSTNHRPVIRELSPAMWGRLLLFPWAVFIPNGEQNTALAEQLAAERPGILRRLVVGCLDWQNIGIRPPEAVQAATEGYRADSDPVGDFLEQCTTTKPLPSDPPGRSARAMAKDLLDAYTSWALKNGTEPMTPKALGEAMGERYKRKPYGGLMSYVGVRLFTGEETRARAEKDKHRADHEGDDDPSDMAELPPNAIETAEAVRAFH